MSDQSSIYQEFDNALDTLLTQARIPFRAIDASQPIRASGLVIGVGLKGATAAAASDAASVINVFISKKNHHKLLHDFPERANSRSISAIYLDQPGDRQAQLIAAILPGKHEVGILHSISSDIDELRQELPRHHMRLNEQRVDSPSALPEALQEILLGRSELLLAQPDAEVYNDSTVRNILMATFRRGIPLIAYSAGFVRAGALCAVFSTAKQIAEQTAAQIIKLNETHQLPSPQYPNEFEVMVNAQVAYSLGLKIKNAATLHEEIDQAIKEAP